MNDAIRGIPILVLFSVFALSIVCSCSSVRQSDGFVKEQVITSIDISEQEQPIISWINTDSVAIGLWGEYNDTVEVYVNGKKLSRTLVENKDKPYPKLDFTGKVVWVTGDRRKEAIEIKLLRQRKKISFLLDRNYPLCNVNHINGNWTISYRNRYKSSGELKIYR